MTRRTEKCILRTLLFAAAFFLLFPVTGYAAEKEEDLYNNQEVQDLMVTIGFDKADVSIAFRDPDGNVIDLDDKNVKYIEMDTMILAVIEDAARGQWRLIYDKGSNASILVDVQPYEEPLWITDLDHEIDKDEMTVRFTAEQEQNLSFQYEIRLGVDEYMSEYRVIGNGYGRPGETCEKTCSLKNVNSFDAYYLQVYAWYEREGEISFDEMVSGPFAYDNPYAPETELEDFHVEIHPTYQTLKVSLDGYASYNARTANVRLQADGNDVKDIFMNLQSSKETVIPYEGEPAGLAVTVTVQDNGGRITDPLEKVISLTPSGDTDTFFLTLPPNGLSRTTSYDYSWINGEEQKVRFVIDDAGPQELILNGSGRDSFELTDEHHDITVSYTDNNNVTWVFEQTVDIDMIPPDLKIYEQMNGMVTDQESVVITGRTDPGSVLTVDGTPVEIAENGAFTWQMNLAEGVNQAVFSSMDPAGNSSVYSMNITRGKDKDEADPGDVLPKNRAANAFLAVLPVIVWCLAGLYVALMALLVVSAIRKKTPIASIISRIAVLTLAFSGAGFVLALINRVTRTNFSNSAEFIAFALDDTRAASDYLTAASAALLPVILLGAVTLLSAAVLVVPMILRHHRKKT